MRPNFSLIAFGLTSAGAVGAALLNLPPLYWLQAGLAALGLGMILFVLKRPGSVGLIFLCLIYGGGFLFSLNRQAYWAEVRYNQAFDKREVFVTGVLIDRPVPTVQGSRFTIKVQAGRSGGPSGKITIFSREPSLPSWYGRRLTVTGKFRAIKPEIKSFPEFFERRGIAGSIFIIQAPTLTKGPGLPAPYQWAEHLRESLIRVGERCLRPENAALLHGMIFGDKLDDENDQEKLVENLRRTGTIHLLSVSGLHIGFAVAFLTLLLRILKVPKRWRIIPLTLGAGFYILMTGMEPPVIRAGLMVLIMLIGELLDAGDDNLNRLSLAALLLVIFNPNNLFEIGFQLSCTATLGVVWLYPLLKEYFPVRTPVLKPIGNGLLVSLGAQLMVLPVIVYYFQQISWSGPLVNLLLIIPAELIVVGGLAGEVLGLFWPFAGRLTLMVIDWALNLTKWIVGFFGSQSWSAFWTPRWPWPWMIGYFLGLILLLDWLRPNLLTGQRKIDRGTALITILVILNLAVWTGFFYQSTGDFLAVDFLDVGQGDAILVRAPDGSSALIDGGDEGRGRQRILPFLRENGIERLNLVFATHGHRDHLGGLDEVLQQVPLDILYLPPGIKGRAFSDFKVTLQKLKISGKRACNRMKFRLGKTIKGEVFTFPSLGSENNRSLVILLGYGKNKLLLTGDLGFEGEEILTEKYPYLLKAIVLKVGHHGSVYSTGRPFLSQVKPGLAVISVGAGNRYGHPGKQTLNRLRSFGVSVCRTDRQGRISLRVYPDKLLVAVAKGGF